jgi:acyl carrier protein
MSSSSCLPASLVDARVAQVLAGFKGVPTSLPQSLTPTSSSSEGEVLFSALGLDRLQVRELVQQLGREFCVDVPYSAAEGFVSAQAAASFFRQHPKAR